MPRVCRRLESKRHGDWDGYIDSEVGPGFSRTCVSLRKFNAKHANCTEYVDYRFWWLNRVRSVAILCASRVPGLRHRQEAPFDFFGLGTSWCWAVCFVKSLISTAAQPSRDCTAAMPFPDFEVNASQGRELKYHGGMVCSRQEPFQAERTNVRYCHS